MNTESTEKQDKQQRVESAPAGRVEKVEFMTWLLAQTHRTGDLGRTARFIASDPAWEKATFANVFGRLIETLASEHLAGLQQAYREYREQVQKA